VLTVSAAFVKAVAGLLVAGFAVSVSLTRFRRVKSRWLLVQLVGAAALVVVACTHVCEALGWFPWMGWGRGRSAGHYLDLSSAIVGITLFPIGFLLDRRQRAS
jgi:hypothetical protein